MSVAADPHRDVGPGSGRQPRVVKATALCLGDRHRTAGGEPRQHRQGHPHHPEVRYQATAIREMHWLAPGRWTIAATASAAAELPDRVARSAISAIVALFITQAV